MGAQDPLGWRGPQKVGPRPQQACQWLRGWVRCWAHSPLIHYLPNSLRIPANPSSLGGPLWMVTPLILLLPLRVSSPIPPLLFVSPSFSPSSYPVAWEFLPSLRYPRPLSSPGRCPGCEKMWIQHPPALSSGLHPERPFSWWNFMFFKQMSWDYFVKLIPRIHEILPCPCTCCLF